MLLVVAIARLQHEFLRATCDAIIVLVITATVSNRIFATIPRIISATVAPPCERDDDEPKVKRRSILSPGRTHTKTDVPTPDAGSPLRARLSGRRNLLVPTSVSRAPPSTFIRHKALFNGLAPFVKP